MLCARVVIQAERELSLCEVKAWVVNLKFKRLAQPIVERRESAFAEKGIERMYQDLGDRRSGSCVFASSMASSHAARRR